jgi:hypothetical protein
MRSIIKQDSFVRTLIWAKLCSWRNLFKTTINLVKFKINQTFRKERTLTWKRHRILIKFSNNRMTVLIVVRVFKRRSWCRRWQGIWANPSNQISIIINITKSTIKNLKVNLKLINGSRSRRFKSQSLILLILIKKKWNKMRMLLNCNKRKRTLRNCYKRKQKSWWKTIMKLI